MLAIVRAFDVAAGSRARAQQMQEVCSRRPPKRDTCRFAEADVCVCVCATTSSASSSSASDVFAGVQAAVDAVDDHQEQTKHLKFDLRDARAISIESTAAAARANEHDNCS